MEIMNEPMKCAVRVFHTKRDVITDDIASIAIENRKKGETEWHEVHRVNYYSQNSLDFEFIDYTVSSHQTYEYRNVLYQTTEGEPILGDIVEFTPVFNGFLIADEYNGYVSVADPKYTYQRDFNVSFVKPYNSKYPHVIRNGESNSCSGTFEGVFNVLDESCRFTKRYADFENEIVEFLSRPTSKIFKTFDGHVWYIYVNTPIKKVADNLDGFVKLQFSWNEIGAVPENINQVITGAMK